MVDYNPFTDCYVEFRDNTWCVVSRYWVIKTVTEIEAGRICDILGAAYKSGYNSKSEEIKQVLGISNQVTLD